LSADEHTANEMPASHARGGYWMSTIDDLRERLANEVREYPEGTGLIAFWTPNGQKTWSVAISADDNEETMRAHLKQYVPEATFLCAVFHV
jgi:hypothetical protein